MFYILLDIKQEDLFKINEIEKAASEIIWCCDESKLDFPNTNLFMEI